MAKQPQSAPASRAEKLSILSTMLGPEALARVREGQPKTTQPSGEGRTDVDADRVNWHRSKLLERLRQHEANKSRDAGQKRARAEAPPSESVKALDLEADMERILDGSGARFDVRIARIADETGLEKEHPAIIARLIKALPREERVDALKSLPGPIARSIVRRLK